MALAGLGDGLSLFQAVLEFLDDAQDIRTGGLGCSHHVGCRGEEQLDHLGLGFTGLYFTDQGFVMP